MTTNTITRTCEYHGDYTATQLAPRIEGLDFGPIFSSCPTCNAQREKERREHEERDREAHAHRLQEGARLAIEGTAVPRRFLGAVFDGETPLHLQLAAYADAIEDHVSAGTGLVLLGPPGGGKTYGFAALLTRLAREHWEQSVEGASPHAVLQYLETAARTGIAYANASHIGLQVRGTFRRDAEQTEAELLEHYSGQRLLALDEVGGAADDHSRQWVAQIVCERYERQRPTLLATNLVRRDLEQYLGSRAADRLTETCRFIAMTGPSRRRATAVSTANNSARGAA